jgi:hypothetical protein
MATSEQYQDFVLEQWYIVTPFTERIESEDGATSSLKRGRNRLSRSDFREFAGRDKINMSELVHQAL